MKAVDKKFYNLFWMDDTCQTIFSNHKTQLLEDEVELIVSKEKFFAQRLVLTNSQKRKSGLKLSKRTENESIEIMHNLQTTARKYFDDEKIEAFIKNRFGKSMKKIERDFKKSGGLVKLGIKLFNSLDSEKDLFNLISSYDLIPKNITSIEEFGKYCENEFTSHMKGFIKKENLSELAISIDLISTYYNLKLRNNLVSATKHYTDVLYDNENYKDRLELYNTLYEIKVLKGGKLKSYYECVNCPPNTYNGILTLNIKPSSLKMKCPACKKDLYYIVPYELDETIYKDIVHKDGLLFKAIQYLLEEYNYNYVANRVEPPDIEIDFCLMNNENLTYEIIEVKMFKTDRPLDTQVGNLREAVSQVKKMINKMMLIDPEYKNIRKSIVTNITDDKVYKTAKKELKSDLKEFNIHLYTMKDFYTALKK